MTLDSAVPAVTRLIEWRDAYKVWVLVLRRRYPVVEIAFFLSALSGAFWFLSQIFSFAVLKVHDCLDDSLAALLAVGYNFTLGVAFSAVLALGIIREKGGTDYFLAYQAAGFAFTYLVLGAAYAERTGEINEYAILGYAGGLVAYLAFCVHTQLLGSPWVGRAYEAVRFVIHGWPGKVASLFSIGQGALFAWHAVQRLARRSQTT